VHEGFAQGHLGFEVRVGLRGLALVFRVEPLAEPGAVRTAAEAGAAIRAEQQLGDPDFERAGDRVGARGSARKDESKTKMKRQRKAGSGRLAQRKMTFLI
jgi:hypothetical protein